MAAAGATARSTQEEWRRDRLRHPAASTPSRAPRSGPRDSPEARAALAAAEREEAAHEAMEIKARNSEERQRLANSQRFKVSLGSPHNPHSASAFVDGLVLADGVCYDEKTPKRQLKPGIHTQLSDSAQSPLAHAEHSAARRDDAKSAAVRKQLTSATPFGTTEPATLTPREGKRPGLRTGHIDARGNPLHPSATSAGGGRTSGGVSRTATPDHAQSSPAQRNPVLGTGFVHASEEVATPVRDTNQWNQSLAASRTGMARSGVRVGYNHDLRAQEAIGNPVAHDHSAPVAASVTVRPPFFPRS